MDTQCKCQNKEDKGTNNDFKTIHRKLKIEKQEPLKTNRSKDEPNISWGNIRNTFFFTLTEVYLHLQYISVAVQNAWSLRQYVHYKKMES
jgi:hypothetical protein